MNCPLRIVGSRNAFSLVELLVVIAVLAIIASLAIPAIYGTLTSSDYSKNLRNAQMLSNVSKAAVAAGFEGTNSVEGWVSLLTNGVSVTNVYGETMALFRVDDLAEADVRGASEHLAIENQKLVYTPSR